MAQIGPALITAGMALLLIPLAKMMGAIGYVFFGGVFVLAGGVLTFASDLFGSSTGGSDRKNCPTCGAPNAPDATSCAHCETTLG